MMKKERLIKMRSLLQSRKTLFSVPGGDTVQVVKTAEALREAGCQADISTELEPDLSGYDIVHLFNITRPQELYLQALNAVKQGKKVALSTIYVDYMEYERKARGGVAGAVFKALSREQAEYLKVLARAVKNREISRGTVRLLIGGYKRLQRRVLEMSSCLLPNSESEMRRLVTDIGSAGKPYIPVPNAVDIGLFNPGVRVEGEAEKARGAVLCVARIEGRKNQLNLVRAMKGLPMELFLIGKAAPNHIGYFEAVKREMPSNVRLIEHMDHKLLPAYYRAAKVHALVSWMETTGLSSLEAGACGCNLLITDKGDTRDYFGDLAWYCDPGSVASIRKALLAAYESPPRTEMTAKIAKEYNWKKTAEKTIEGYEICLRK